MKYRGLLFFLMFILAGWTFATPAHAQGLNVAPSASEVGAIVDQKAAAGQMSKEVYSVNTQALYMAGATCMITGCSTSSTSAFYYGKSAIASMGNVMAAMYGNPPADLALWVSSTAQTLGFAPKKVNAQGIGFAGLSALLPIWAAFRNVAYFLLAIVMIVIGFMIMFRKKIDPKTVITVQNALPKIVITLLLITFSYAIVGLMIDLMYLVIALTASILIPVSNGALATTTASRYLNGNIGTLFGAVFGGGFRAFDDIVRLISWNNGFGVVGAASQVFNTITTSVLIGLILAIALLIAYIRILFLLVGAYIQIIIALLTGPLQILTEALPGSTGFASWFKNLFANIAVFPITAAMLMIGTILASFDPAFPGIQTPTAAKLWTPPLLSGGGTSGIIGIIGLGLLFTIPGIANAIKEALKAKPAVNAGPGAIFGPIGSGAGQAMQLWYQGTFITAGLKHGQPQPKPSTPLGRQVQAGKGGSEAVLNTATGMGE